MNTAQTCTVTGADLCFIELGVGSTLLVLSSVRGSTLFIADSFYPAPMNSLVCFSYWKFNTFLGHNKTVWNSTRTFLVSCWILLKTTQLIDFFPSPVHETSLLLIRPQLVVSMQCTFLCAKYFGRDSLCCDVTAINGSKCFFGHCGILTVQKC